MLTGLSTRITIPGAEELGVPYDGNDPANFDLYDDRPKDYPAKFDWDDSQIPETWKQHANRIRNYPDGTPFETMYALVAETVRRGGVRLDLGPHLTPLFLDAGLPWPTIKAETPVGGEPGT